MSLASQRIAVVHYLSGTRGSVTVCAMLVKKLRSLGADAHLFTLQEPVTSDYLDSDDVPHTFVARAEFKNSLRDQALRSSTLLADNLDIDVLRQYDIVHIHEVIDHMAISRIRDKIPNALIVRTMNHFFDDGEEWFLEAQQRAVVETDQVITVSQYWKDRVYEKYGKNSVVIYNGMDAEAFQEAPERLHGRSPQSQSNDSIVFLHIGDLSPRKGSLELVQAFAAAKSTLSGISVQLVVLGGRSTDPYREYRANLDAEIARLGLIVGKDIVLRGNVDGAQLVNAYHGADVFVFPSLIEGWGLVVLEAMAAGLPVIMSDLPVFREFAGPDDAIFVRPADVGDLADAMQTLALNPERRVALGTRGAPIAARYSWSEMAEAHASLFDALLTAHRIGEADA